MNMGREYEADQDMAMDSGVDDLPVAGPDDGIETHFTSQSRAQSGGKGACDTDTRAVVDEARTAIALLPSAAPGPRLMLIQDPYDPRSEKVRALRTELLMRREDNEYSYVLALLSPGSGEGRSQLAAELAIAFAQLGRPTLLVDADLRNPAQHVLFCADNTSGLAQSIETGTAPHLHPVDGIDHLSLLTSGQPPHNPMDLLSDRRFGQLIENWRERFDFVIIDTPPTDRYSDGLAVATVVGEVLAISRSHHTSQRDTREMLRRLGATRARILGAVINHF